MADIYGGDRLGAVNFQIETLIARYNHLLKIADQLQNNDILCISFENLINNYDSSVKSVENFIGLKKHETSLKMKFFNPDFSLKNIGIYKDILTREECNLIERSDVYALIDKIKDLPCTYRNDNS